MKTEAEARKCACHKTIMQEHLDDDSSQTAWTPCIASECMAWRWYWREHPKGGGEMEPGAGFCGLAGPL